MAGDTTGFYADYDGACGQAAATPDAVVAFVAPSDGRYYATVVASFDAVLSVWKGGCGLTAPQIGCTDDYRIGQDETLEFDLLAGDAVHVLIGASSTSQPVPTTGAFELEVGLVACGDGKITGLEQCEDGNSVEGDGCSSLCRWEGDNCGDAFDLNQSGGADPTWPDWFMQAADKWLWAGNTSLFSDDFVGQCRAGPSRDGVARFTAPASGLYHFVLVSNFESTLEFMNASCSPFQPAWCGDGPQPPLGLDEVVWRLSSVNLNAGDVTYLVVDGQTPADFGDFWLYIDGRFNCGNGVVDPSELCDDGNDVQGDGCTDCRPDAGTSPGPLTSGSRAHGNLLVQNPPVISGNTFLFEAVSGVTYSLETRRSDYYILAQQVDTLMRLRDSSGVVLAENDDRSLADPTSRIVWTAPLSGTFVIEVEAGPNLAYPPTFEGHVFNPYPLHGLGGYFLYELRVEAVPGPVGPQSRPAWE